MESNMKQILTLIILLCAYPTFSQEYEVNKINGGKETPIFKIMPTMRIMIEAYQQDMKKDSATVFVHQVPDTDICVYSLSFERCQDKRHWKAKIIKKDHNDFKNFLEWVENYGKSDIEKYKQ